MMVVGLMTVAVSMARVNFFKLSLVLVEPPVSGLFIVRLIAAGGRIVSSVITTL